MATTDKLSYLKETKELLREKINSKGGTLEEAAPFRDYVNAVDDIKTEVTLPVSEEVEF